MNPQEPMQPQQQPQQPTYGGIPPMTPPAQPSSSMSPQHTPMQPIGSQSPQPASPQIDYLGGPSREDRHEYSIDYLNKIAPKEQRNINKFAVFGLIGGVLLTAIFALILMTRSGGPSPNAQLPIVASRINTLQAVTAEQQPHLNVNQISEANAALRTTLSTMNTDITAIMKERKLKADKDLTAKETAYREKLSKSLNDSHQRGTLNRTYTSQMRYELTLLRSQVVTLKKVGSTDAIKKLCNNGIENIDLILKSYASFDASKS